jgi:TIR domain
MRPGERIPMIIKSAEILASRDWGEACLICREFGFKFDDPEYSNPDNGWWMYVLQQSEQGDLPGLHAYLSGDDAPPQSRGKWATIPLFVFLSHLYVRRNFAARLQMCLRRYGIESFVAHNDIEPSKAWRDEIKAALASCHAFVALLHDGFHESEWCDQEVGWALARNIPIVPVRFPGSERRDGFLADFQDVNMAREDERGLSRQIFTTLFNDPRTHSGRNPALAEAFVNSSSFDMTRWLWDLITAEPHLQPEQLRRLEHAVSTNRQVYEAMTRDGKPIPELVGQLVKRHEPPVPASPNPWADEPPF